MAEESLAIIEPLEFYMNQKECPCRISFLTGKLKTSTWERELTTGIFRYYFFGAALEVVETDGDKVTDVHDIRKEDIQKFGLGLAYVLTYNSSTYEALASNGFIYKLDQSTFYKRFPSVVRNMHQYTHCGSPFVWQLYLLNGAVAYIEMITDIEEGSAVAKYRLGGGYVVSDRAVLKCMLPKTYSELKDASRVLSQDEIDDLFNRHRQGLI